MSPLVVPEKESARDGESARPEVGAAPPPELAAPRGVVPAPRAPLAVLGVTVAAVAAGPAVGAGLAWMLADGAGLASFAGVAGPIAVLGGGYQLWRARLASIAFHGLFRGLLRALFGMLVRRRAPRLEDVLPDRERLARMAAQALRAASSFRLVAALLALPAAALAAIAAPDGSRTLAGALLAAWLVVYGGALTRLARRGWLPIPEDV